MTKLYSLFLILIFCVGVSAQRKPVLVNGKAATESEKPPTPKEVRVDGELSPKTNKTDSLKLMLEIITAETNLRLCALDPSNAACKENPAEKLTELYSQALTSPETAKILIAKLITDYQGLRESARSAPQVSQAADESGIKMQIVLISQNQKIIELLEQLVKKR